MLNSQCDIQEVTCGCRGVKAIWCPQTGNVNFEEVTQHLFKDFETFGGKTMFNTKVRWIKIIFLSTSKCNNFRLKISHYPATASTRSS